MSGIKREYKTVDLMKFIFCVCIIALHTNFLSFLPGNINDIITKSIFRLAVPYYFVASGYFFKLKIDKDIGNEKKVMVGYLKRLLKPYIFFSVINIAIESLIMLKNGVGLQQILVVNLQHMLFYPYGALWYVWASIIGIVLLFPFYKYKKLNLALILGIVLYSFALLCNNYYFVAELLGIKKVIDVFLSFFISSRNGLFTGFLFLALGMKCCDWKDYFKSFKLYTVSYTIYILYVVEVLLLIREGNFADDGSLYILHIILIPVLMLLTLQINVKLESETAVVLRNLSTGMYFLHRPVLSCISILIGLLPIRCNNVVLFLLVFIISFFTCKIFYKIKKEPFYSLLK